MTEIALVLAIVLASLFCFVTGVLRIDIVALLVLISISATGLVTPAEALAGFSNPAVITIAGMFVISAALARTGVASLLGKRIHKLAGASPQKLLAILMLTVGVLSAFMNSVGLAAMMLPVVMDLARRTNTPPSKLLMPMVLGALLGGTTSLIGTAGNIVASNALSERNLEPFQVFDFTPIGSIILISGVAFVSLIGYRLLPSRDPHRTTTGSRDEELARSFDLQDRLFVVRVPANSPLDGKSLAASRLGSALGLHVVAILRPAGRTLAPGPATVLHSNDRLLVEGRPDLLLEIQRNRHLLLQETESLVQRLDASDFALVETDIPPQSALVGRTLVDVGLRTSMGVLALAIVRDGVTRLGGIPETELRSGDKLLLQGTRGALEALSGRTEFANTRNVAIADALARYGMSERLVTLRVTEGSMLIGRSLAESRLADAAGLTIVAIVRGDSTLVAFDAEQVLQEGDALVVSAAPDDLRVLRGLQKLSIEEGTVPDLSELESENVGLLEVVLAPRNGLVGKTPRQLHFREKYGLSLLAIWREGRPLRSNLRDVPLRFGDSLLVFGPRSRLRVLAAEPDFIGLTQGVQPEPRTNKAPMALAILAVALVPALTGLLPIAVSVIMGATLAVLTKCLTPEEAYRGVELSAIVLVAAMLPLGTALDKTGAAELLANGVLDTAGALGPRGVLAAICIMTAIGSQAIPATALIVLMAPIAITAADTFAISPQALMMGVALSASSLSSPVGHPANALIMGPGAYRYGDYVKVGLPLTIMLLLIVIFVMPFFFPLG